MDRRCCLLHLIQQNFLLKTFLRILILMTWVSLYLFSPLELIGNCIIFLQLPKLVKMVITNLHSSKVSSSDCIRVVLKNCKLELSYILAELFNMCLKESCNPDCWKFSLVVPVFKNVRERSATKNNCPVSFLSVVSKAFGKVVDNKIVDQCS